jgi:Ca-activated chloride channel family protein
MRRHATALLVLAAAGSADQVAAQRSEDDPSTPGALEVPLADGGRFEMPLRHTDVRVEISAFLARTTVEQVFVNPFPEPIEARYTFPLGDQAAVDDFELRAGDLVVRGEIHRREEARRLYEAARQEGYQAALLEQARPNVFVQSIANLMPGSEVRVRVSTVELLEYRDGGYQYVFPLVVGPRYLPGDAFDPEQPVEARLNPPRFPPDVRSGHDVSLHVDLAAGVEIQDVISPNQTVYVMQHDPEHAEVELGSEARIPNKDFVLRWRVADEAVQIGQLAHRDGADGYVTLLVQPKASIEAREVAPRDVVFVLDTSGSMDGTPIEMSLAFVKQALRELGTGDRFNLIQFAGEASTYSPRSVAASPQAIARALRWLGNLDAEGGTEMLEGLARVLDDPVEPGTFRQVILLSDGEIGNEDELVAATQELPDEFRVFTLGIGSGVNHSVLRRMAEVGGGEYTFIPDDSDRTQALRRFHDWVTRPYLTDVEVDWGGLPIRDVVPQRVHDLLSGKNLYLIARYDAAAIGTVTLHGYLSGRRWSQTIEVELPEREEAHSALGPVWARLRIEELLRESAADPAAVREPVTELALAHRLMSPFTSFVAVDTSRVVNPGGELVPVDQPAALPEESVSTDESIVEHVWVEAASDIVDLENTSQTTRFSDSYVEDLPVAGRFYQNVLAFAPGVQDADGDGNPNVHGARDRDFKALVSGISNVDPVTGQRMFEVNPNSIEEMEVLSAGASVEFRRAQGGFARILQKQGSNDFEGVFEVLYRSRAFDGDGAGDFSDTEVPDFATYQPSILVSGPLVKDKLWYRLSHEAVHEESPVNVADGIEVMTDERTIHSDQITWQVSPRNKLAFQFEADPRTITNFGVSSFTPSESSATVDLGGETYSLTWTAPHSPAILIESQVAWQDLHSGVAPTDPSAAASCVSGPAFLERAHCLGVDSGEISGPFPQKQDDHRQRLTVRADATMFGGRILGATHQFRFGMSVENERYFRRLEQRPDVNLFLVGGSSSPDPHAIVFGDFPVPNVSEARATGIAWGLYGEDQIKPAQNLTLTVGLAIEREEITSAGNGTFQPEEEYRDYLKLLAADVDEGAAFQRAFTAYEDLEDFYRQLADQLQLPFETLYYRQTTAALQSTLWDQKRRSDNVNLVNTNPSPFLSVAWDPFSNGKTKVSASARRYYGATPLLLPVSEIDSSSAFVAFDATLQQGVWTIPDGPAGLRNSVSPAVNVDAVARDLRTPYNDEWTIGFEREIATETSLKLTYVHRKFRDQFQDIDLNHVPLDAGRCNATSTAPGDRFSVVSPADGILDDCAGELTDDISLQKPDGVPDLYVQNPGWGNVLYVGNLNEIDYEAYVLELLRRQYRNWELQGSYTWSKAVGNGEDYNQGLGNDRTLIEDERGYQSYDQRHAVKVAATTVTPWGLRVGGSVIWQSGLPYSILQRQISFDSITPEFQDLGVAGAGRARTTYLGGQRNSERNISYWDFNVKVTKEFHLGRGVNAQASVEIFNLLNDGTYMVYNPFTESGQQINGTNDTTRRFGRQWQLGLRLAF